MEALEGKITGESFTPYPMKNEYWRKMPKGDALEGRIPSSTQKSQSFTYTGAVVAERSRQRDRGSGRSPSRWGTC